MRHVIFKTLFFIGYRENTLDLGLDLDLRKFSQGFEEDVTLIYSGGTPIKKSLSYTET